MFLFIVFLVYFSLRVTDSNTSHVLIYHNRDSLVDWITSDSNTSHVLIYLTTSKTAYSASTFKYISCSYLSSALNWFFPVSSNSNTSHVLIYLYSIALTHLKIRFKYISCSYLSNVFITIFSSIV